MSEKLHHYQSLIGGSQWYVSLGCYDMQWATMMMGNFHAAPRTGHLNHLQHACGYLYNYSDEAIHFCTKNPDYSALEHVTHDWEYCVYGGYMEELPSDIPLPKGKPVQTTTFEVANLMHDLITSRSATGIIHLVRQTPV